MVHKYLTYHTKHFNTPTLDHWPCHWRPRSGVFPDFGYACSIHWVEGRLQATAWVQSSLVSSLQVVLSLTERVG